MCRRLSSTDVEWDAYNLSMALRSLRTFDGVSSGGVEERMFSGSLVRSLSACCSRLPLFDPCNDAGMC
jgi:hypothetical protein